jgi:tRNA dimethylallyltransferase
MKMSMVNSRGKVLILIGPTAVGKTALSIRLAERFDGEIISADSRLLYRGMDIGTAKPSKAEVAIAPHHLIDLADPEEVWSLALYQKAVLEKIEEVISRQHLPIIVGGTGQYIRSLVEGWILPTQQPHPVLRQVLENWAGEIGPEKLHQKLGLIDPQAASKIDANNLRRTVRALEVIFCTGRLFSQQQERAPLDLDFKVIGLARTREDLYARVDERIEAMFDQGFVDEVKALLAKGYSDELSTLSAIGYREVIQAVKGEMSLEEAKVVMRRKTRQFVRRQANWFKPDDPMINWFSMIPDPLGAICAEVRKWKEPTP